MSSSSDDTVDPISSAPSASDGQADGSDSSRSPVDPVSAQYGELINALGVASYLTDARGHITVCNKAAIELWGRRPELGKDRWCGSWRLYRADGSPLPHDECPLAISLKENRPIHGEELIAERPDGTRVSFIPHPVPLRDERGALIGAVNVLADVTDQKRMEEALDAERERLNLAMTAGAMGTWEWNMASGSVAWSESLEAIHGRPAGTFGGTFDDFLRDVHPDDRALVRETIRRSLKQGVHEMDYRIIRPDGSTRWLSARGRVITDISGQPTKMTGVCMDVTERKHWQEGERFLTEATVTLAATSPDYSMTLASLARLAVPRLGDWCAIDVLEEDGTVTNVALTHSDRAMVERAREVQRRYPFDPDRPYGVARVLKTGQPEFYPEISDTLLREVIDDDSLVRVIREARLRSVICAPLIARGRTLGAITLATAESGRRYDKQDLALAQELARRAGLAVDNARLYQQLLEANEAKDEFLGLVSHELRSPITTIYGGARVLQTRGEGLDPEKRSAILSDIAQESERLSSMVENLLALARVELGQSITTEPILARRVIQKVVSSFRQRHPGREVELTVEGDPEPVTAQPTFLDLVVRNLISNADKYSPEGVPIEVRLRVIDEGIECLVLDRGPGIDEAQAEQIFERFYRSEGPSKAARGAGLGLTVCRRLVEAQGGRIWARPREGGGLEVGFVLPRYEEDQDE